MRKLFCLFIVSLACTCAAGRTITVDCDGPADFNNIQAAIYDSNDGDIIIVSPGTYSGPGNHDIDFCGKAITIRSVDPNDFSIVTATVIDCNGTQAEPHRGFYFHSGEGVNSVVAGLTVTNGWTYGGGAIRCRYSSSPTILNCMMIGNVAGRPPVSDPPIPTVPSSGGAIYCSSSSGPTISNCLLVNNKATASGGAIWSHDSHARVANCIISGNRAHVRGGGIILYESTMSIKNCLVCGNATGFPGALPSQGHSGGAIYSGRSTLTICHSTLTGNASLGKGGGIHIREGNAAVTNCVIWANSAFEGPEIAIREGLFGPASLTVSYTDVKGGRQAVYVHGDSTLFWGPDNIDADPCFAVPGYWDANGTPDDVNDDLWVEGDYHLRPTSPCIDAGDPNYVAEPDETDLDGNPRIIDGDNDGVSVVDMGAYEFFLPLVECPMRFTPKALNLRSKGKWVKAHLVLPEGHVIESVDANNPVKVVEPFEPGIQSQHLNVFINEGGLVEIVAAFPRGEFCQQSVNGELIEVRVEGVLTTGQVFYGTTTIKVMDNRLKRLAGLAAYWLEANCGKPDWCAGLDLDHNGVVNFADFALTDGCREQLVNQ